MNGKGVAMVAVAVAGVVLLAGFGTLAYAYAALPDPNQLRHLRGDGLVVLKYADGSPLALMGKRPGPFLQPGEVPETVRQGFLATEDIRFFEHKGVDWRGIGRALMVDLKSAGKGRIEGGSTITQQLVRNYFFKASAEGGPRPRRGLTAKLREALMAVKLERSFTKYEILQAYMTVIQYGADKWGVADAAQYYFGKDVRSVTLSEAAMIVGSANATHAYDPHHDSAKAWERAVQVLDKMQKAGVIDQAVHDAAVRSPPVIAPPASAPLSRWAADRIEDNYSLLTQASDRSTRLTVATTLNRDAQAAAEKAVIGSVGVGQPVQAVLVALDATGAVKAFVPATTYSRGRGYADERRQIGSVMKTFIYAAALQEHARPQDLCDDVTGYFGPARWSPHDDDPPMGRITLATAFAHSSNIVAARLGNEVGRDQVASIVQRLGMPAPPPASSAAWPLSSIASPLEVARAFLPFANGGRPGRTRFADSVIDGRGAKQWAASTEQAAPLLGPEVLAPMHTLMRGVVTGGTGMRAGVKELWVGGKTGTTQRNVNTWFAGYGDGFVVVVWVGRPLDQKPMPGAFGGVIPATIFHNFMAAQKLGWGSKPPPGFLEAASAPQSVPPPSPLAPLPALPGADATSSLAPADPFSAPPSLFSGSAQPATGQGCRAA